MHLSLHIQGTMKQRNARDADTDKQHPIYVVDQKTKAGVYFCRRLAQMLLIDTEEFNRMMKISALIRALLPKSQLYFAADISFSQ